MAVAGAHPVHVDTSLNPPLWRWLWILNWPLAIPRYAVPVRRASR